jgi:heterodisulfide reductase subunit A2
MPLTTKTVAVIGAGPAGLQLAASLSQLGIAVRLYEKEEKPGGHLASWHSLFPDLEPADDLLQSLVKEIANRNVEFISGHEVTGLMKSNGSWNVELNKGEPDRADAVVIASGFNSFKAELKEEYGFGLYPAVVTSVDVEGMLNQKRAWPFSNNSAGLRFGLVHCVGSRDLKCGNTYCSKVCCATAVKQSIELKKRFPESSVFCFYMDMRMFGLGYEELYQKAQVEYNVQFIRGRLSEAAPAEGNRVVVKAEDTLMGRPVKLTLDMLVLMVGMTPANVSSVKGGHFQLEKPGFASSFIQPVDKMRDASLSNEPGLFISGSCKGPATLPEVIQDARATSLEVYNFLSGK